MSLIWPLDSFLVALRMIFHAWLIDGYQMVFSWLVASNRSRLSKYQIIKIIINVLKKSMRKYNSVSPRVHKTRTYTLVRPYWPMYESCVFIDACCWRIQLFRGAAFHCGPFFHTSSPLPPPPNFFPSPPPIFPPLPLSHVYLPAVREQDSAVCLIAFQLTGPSLTLTL
jgi:hypothetical protein